ncbi:hypothetical protein ACFFX0_20825 [Citricoccus parietis]|uniref:Uncharacterized protein n=1 Tax=Citricoccus parietis TaxID=592307 RepID=A0ABV5G3I1_9MICC
MPVQRTCAQAHGGPSVTLLRVGDGAWNQDLRSAIVAHHDRLHHAPFGLTIHTLQDRPP